MTKTGSYQIDEIKNLENELKRLEVQAQLMKPLEVKLLKETGLLPDFNVLEVGCGPGFITSILCELASDGQVFATDTDEKLLELCRKRITKPPRKGFLAINSSKENALEDLKSSIDYSYLRFVLQHVPEKEVILSEIYNVLKPKGIICALDSDDGLVIQYPEDDFVKNLLSEARDKQSLKGGDRFIGRKIPSLFAKAGFINIQTRILNFTNKDIPFSILARILFGFKSELIGKRNEMEEWIKKTEPQIKSGDYFLSGGVILTTAQK